jgi:hypothetical protein
MDLVTSARLIVSWEGVLHYVDKNLHNSHTLYESNYCFGLSVKADPVLDVFIIGIGGFVEDETINVPFW